MEPWRKISHWVCDSGRTKNPQQSGHCPPPRPHNGVTLEVGHGMQAWLKAASIGEIRRSPKIARWRFTFNFLVEIASKDDSAYLHAQVADEQQERDANRPPLGALIVDVNIGDCEEHDGSGALRNLLVTTMPSTAHVEYLSKGRGQAYTRSRA